jgi:hypothetical protein
MVALVRVGVDGGDDGDRPLEGVVFTQIGGDRDPVA